MDSNWRSPLQADSGQRIVNKSSSLDSTAHTGNSKWQEEVYQKIKVATDLYFAEVHDIYQKLCLKLQQHESLSQQAKSEVDEKLKFFKQMLEHILQYLQIPQSGIQYFHKDRLAKLEKRILGVLSAHRASQPRPSLQQGEIPQPHLQSLQQNQQSHSQIHQTQSHESGVNSKLELVKVEGSSVPTMQLGKMSGLHCSVSSLSGINCSQPNMMNSLQPCSNLDSGQGNAPISVQQVAMGSIQENPASDPQQASVNLSTPQIGVNLFHLKTKLRRTCTLQKSNIYQRMCAELLQHEPLSQQTKSDEVEKLKFYKHLLEHILQYLQIPRNSIQPFHKDRLPALEKQILRILSSHGPINPCPPLQQRQIPQPLQQSLPQNQQSQSHQSGVNSQLQPVNVQCSSVPILQPGEIFGLHGSGSFLSGINSSLPNTIDSFTEAPFASLDSTAHAANFDWQEEVYQKLKVMNDSYFADIHAIYQKTSAKLEQLESPSQQANAEAVEKLKFFKKTVERIIQYLQIPQSNIQSFHKDKLPTLEKLIVSILATLIVSILATRRDTITVRPDNPQPDLELSLALKF